MNREDIESVLPGIYRIPVPLKGNPLKELNSYLILGAEKNLLIDTGFYTEDCRKELKEGLELLGVSMENTDILVTHLHSDHSGNASELICNGNRIYMSGIDVDYLKRNWDSAGDQEIHTMQKRFLLEHGVDAELVRAMLNATPSKTMAAPQEFDEFTRLEDGDRINVGDYTLRAVLTPGHTPGQMCFDIEGTGAMILGDHVLFDITPNITSWPEIEDSLGDYLKSLDKIDAYDVTIPLPGHRKPGDFHERIAHLKKHHEKRLSECLEVVRMLGQAKIYDIAGNMTWKIRADNWDTFPAAQRWFALGECRSHLDHLQKYGKIRSLKENGVWYYEVVD